MKPVMTKVHFENINFVLHSQFAEKIKNKVELMGEEKEGRKPGKLS